MRKEDIPLAEQTESIDVNGVRLYHEIRGSGSPVLFISGATGDAGHFERVAQLLSDEFTIVTYDRRGYSRSSRPDSWDSTSPAEQSDDAAALIQALDIAPASVFGTSSGAIIALDLVLRHPDVLRGAILHEPPMISVVSNAGEAMAPIQEAVERGMQKGGPPQAMEEFLRLVAGGEVFEKLDPRLRERMVGNSDTFFNFEFGALEPYHPDEAALAAVKVPVQVAVGRESIPLFLEGSGWIAEHLNVELKTLPDAHTPYFDRPEEMAEAIRPLLRSLAE
jgi:pimeloyl-ACP methyl ester carboxylesterase